MNAHQGIGKRRPFNSSSRSMGHRCGSRKVEVSLAERPPKCRLIGRSVVPVWQALIAVAVTIACVGLVAQSAEAATAIDSFAYESTFGRDNVTPFGSQHSGIVLDEGSGHIFLTALFEGTVAIYAGDVPGEPPLTEIPVNSLTGKLAENLALDPTSQALYVEDDSFFGPQLNKLDSDGQPTPTYNLDPTFTPGISTDHGGMAVDPITGDLLVAVEGEHKVYRLDPADGSVISTLEGTPDGAFQTPTAVGVATDGDVYVLDAGRGRIDRFHSDGAWQGRLALPAGSEPQSIAMNPATEDLAVVDLRNGQDFIDGFASSGAALFSAPFPADKRGQTYGLVWAGASDRIYVNKGTNAAYTFVPATQPGVDPPSATSGRNTVHAEAEVAPGGEPTTAWIEYCPATAGCDSFGVGGQGNPWKRGPAHEGLTATTTIEDDLPLQSNAVWKLRVTAENSKLSNTSTTSTIVSPLLAPTVETQEAASVTETSAELTGTIDPIGDLSTYHFEYGLTTNYGARVPASSEAPAGNNRQPRQVTLLVSGLQPERTYHFRLVATNGAGPAVGADRTFTTSGPASAPARGYEMVTPVDQRGALVNGATNFWAGADGSWFSTGTGSVEATGNSSVVWSHYLSRRGSAGWERWTQLDPPRHKAPATTEGAVAAISEDGTRALVVSNVRLAEGAIDDGANLYIYDTVDGHYETVGSCSNTTYPEAYTWLVGIQQIDAVYVGGTPNFSTVVFRSIPPLLPGVTGPQVYRWTRAGGLELASTVDGSPPAGESTSPSPASVSLRQVSADGGATYFSLTGGPDFGVYRRADGETKPISVVEGDPARAPMPGQFWASSRDGRYGIFTSFVPLTPAAEAVGGPWLFRYDAETESVTFLSTIATGNAALFAVSEDARTAYFQNAGKYFVWRDGQSHAIAPESGSAVASPDGRYFAWIDHENRLQVYDAVSETVACASCLPDGSAGSGAYMRNDGRPPGNRAPRTVLDNGMVLFSTANKLVAGDRNGTNDVYAYKDGHLTLISPGDGPYSALIAEATPDGHDIFFTTDESLVPSDTNNLFDVYDARIGGGFPEDAAPIPCAGESCKAPPRPAPSANGIGSTLTEGATGKSARKAVVNGVQGLGRAARVKLSQGGTVRLRVRVNGPGKVWISGIATGATVAAVDGIARVPIRLTKHALATLRSTDTLMGTILVHFRNARPKVVSVTLRSATSKKGGS